MIPWSHIIAERRRVRVGATVRHKYTGRRGRILYHVEVKHPTPCHAQVEWRDGTTESVRLDKLHEIAAGELAV